MTGAQLRARIERLGLSQAAMAERLGLSLNGLVKQLRGERRVSRQTEIILDQIEELLRLRRAQRQSELPLAPPGVKPNSASPHNKG